MSYSGGKLYFNTPWRLYCCNKTAPYDLQPIGESVGENENIFGCKVEDGKLNYLVADYSDEDNLIYTKRSITVDLYTTVANGDYGYYVEGNALNLKLESGAKVVVACYAGNQMTAVQVVTDPTASIPLSGDDWAIFSVSSDFIPKCGAVRKAA